MLKNIENREYRLVAFAIEVQNNSLYIIIYNNLLYDSDNSPIRFIISYDT